MTLPDCRVEGAAPARLISACGVGNRLRQSPISASSRAARMVPALSRLVKMAASGWGVNCSAMVSSSASIWVLSVCRAATNASVTAARAVASGSVAPLVAAAR